METVIPDTIMEVRKVREQFCSRFTKVIKTIIAELNEKASRRSHSKAQMSRDRAFKICGENKVSPTWDEMVKLLCREYSKQPSWRMCADDEKIWVIPYEPLELNFD